MLSPSQIKLSPACFYRPRGEGACISKHWHKLLFAVSLLSALAITPAVAGPNGATVVQGSATVQGQGTPSVVVNQTSQNAIINWQTFNIGAGQTTKILMPNSNSTELDRVTGGLGPSQILGSLYSNGQVFLVNPDGILFGAGARINVGGLLATTNNITNNDFMAGHYNFSMPGNPTASVVNLGSITAQTSGFAALVAPGVRNTGIITAKLGTIALASGNAFTLDLYGDNLITLGVNDSIAATVRDVATGRPLRSLVSNTGTLKANGGTVVLTAAAARKVVNSVINNSGVIEANTIGTHNGRIVLGAATGASKSAGAPTQTVKVAGKLSAAGTAPGTPGGTVEITGENILVAGANIDASGQAGGGTVLIGGDTGGGKPSALAASIPRAALEPYAVPTATTVSVDANSVINASAIAQGNGGKVVVWSNQATASLGTILAEGGKQSGNGGFVETSGGTLAFSGSVNTSAPNGKTGAWLLDPTDLTIDATAAAAIDAALATTNVTLQTFASGPPSGPAGTTGNTNTSGAGNIEVASNISWSSANTLTLSAYANINVDLGVTITNTGAGNLVLQSDNTGTGTGGVFLSNNETSNSFVDFSQSTGTVSIFYNTNSVIGVQTNPGVANQLQLHLYEGQATAAYVTGSLDPWSISPSDPGSPDSAMNAAFGAGNWTKFYGFNTAVFGGEYKFVYMDAGGNGTDNRISSQFNAFVGSSSDITAMQNFVSSGGSLFLNAGELTAGTNPSSAVSGTVNVGFGAALLVNPNGSLLSTTGTAVNASDPIFNGMTGTSWTGNFFSHAVVTGAGLQPLITGAAGTVLEGENYGLGYVLVGGMTSTFFQQPQPQADDLRTSIVSYAASQSVVPSPIVPPPTPSPPPVIPVLPPPQPQIANNPANPVTPASPTNAPVINPQAPSEPPPAAAPGPAATPAAAPQISAQPGLFDVPPAGETRYVSDEVLVQVSCDTPQKTIDTVAHKLHLSIVASRCLDQSHKKVLRMHIDNGHSVADVIRALAAFQVIAVAQPNYTYQAKPDLQNPGQVTQTPGGNAVQYAVAKLDLTAIHQVVTGSGIKIAVIDSQVDAKNPELGGGIAAEYNAVGVTEPPDAHGTEMAGVIAAHDRLTGIAPGAQIYAVHAFSRAGDTPDSTTFSIVNALNWAIGQDVRVINMSFTGPRDPSIDRALQAAHDKGIVLIAAAGNFGPDSPPLYPGANPNVIAVTATDSNDMVFSGANHGSYIAVAAPGVDIAVPAPDGTYELTTGTSVAAAEVSGIVALMLQRNPALTPDDVRRILTLTARHPGTQEHDDTYGWGLVDLTKAIQAAAEVKPAPSQ